MVASLALAAATLLIGLIAGYYARDVHDRIRRLYAMFRERIETPAGVVKPIVTRGETRAAQLAEINLAMDSDEGGGVLRPTPTQAEAMKELGERSLLAGAAGRRKRVKEL